MEQQETLDIALPELAAPEPEVRFKGHGWARDDTTFAIGMVPTRTRPVLYSAQGGVVSIYATFRDWTAAYDAMAVIDHVVGIVSGEVLEGGG